jgi:DNA-binding NarL/FixJ family response regulator
LNKTKQAKFTLMVADPSPSSRAIFGQLGEEFGMVSVLCESVAETRKLLADEQFNLVITAAEFSDGSYLDVLDSVREHMDMVQIPVLLMMAGRNEELVQHAFDKGITEVFYKRNMDDMSHYLESFGASLSAQKKTNVLGRALVVEDDHTLGAHYKTLLTKHGFTVDHVPSGEAALWEAEQRRYDFILVDLVLGGSCSGIQFLRRLRQPGMASAHAVAIAMSSYSDEARRIEALRASANAFLTKPLNHRELAAHIEGMAMRPPADEGDRSDDGVEAEKHRCTRCQPCQLTPRESNICALVASGFSDKRIAEEMGVSYWTVRTHIAHAFKKCDVVNRVELVRRLQGG